MKSPGESGGQVLRVPEAPLPLSLSALLFYCLSEACLLSLFLHLHFFLLPVGRFGFKMDKPPVSLVQN